MRIQYLATLIPSVVGVALAFVAYMAPFGNTGVDGSPGALLALMGAVAAGVCAAVAMAPAVRSRALNVLSVLLFVAAGLTALAAYFLMQYTLSLAMVGALLGLLLALAYSIHMNGRAD